MSWNRLFVLFFSVLVNAASLDAARNKPSYDEDKSILFREILDTLDSLRHEVNNHEAEIRMFEEKFNNQEDILDSLRKQIAATSHSIKGQSVNVEAKLAGHEGLAQTLSSDLKSFAKESNQALIEYKSRLTEIEKAIETQNRNIENLQAAMKTLLEALQIKEAPSTPQETGKFYQVKAGDSLEKIARQNQTSIKKLKELNNLPSDHKIIIGKKLKLPEPD
jgi:LysM repeat protein